MRQHTYTHRTDAHTAAPVAEFATNPRDVASCRVCGRTLLLGERSFGHFTAAGEGPYDVCELCVPAAASYGLLTEPPTPREVQRTTRKRDRGVSLRRFRNVFHRKTPELSAPLSATGTAAIPVALARFNASEQARMLRGLIRTLGDPRVCVTPRSPSSSEIEVTVAWDIRWYTFRVAPDGIATESGNHVETLPERRRTWNASATTDGHVLAPRAERIVETDSLYSTVRTIAHTVGSST